MGLVQRACLAGTTTKARNEIPVLATVTFVQQAFFKVDLIFTFYLYIGCVGEYVLLSASDGEEGAWFSGAAVTVGCETPCLGANH